MMTPPTAIFTRLLHMAMLLMAALLVTADLSAAQPKKKTRTQTTVKKEQQDNRKKIQETNRRIAANKKRTLQSLNELNSINSEIEQNTLLLKHLTARLDSLDKASAALADTVATLDKRLADMQHAYAASVRATQAARKSRLTRLAFIFASESFTQAYRRVRYLDEYSQWQHRKTGEIRHTRAEYTTKKERLDSTLARQRATVGSIEKAQNDLARRQKRTDQLVTKLKKEKNSLNQVLKEQQQKAAQLDKELDRIIAEEARRAAEDERRAAEKKAREEAKAKQQSQAKTQAQTQTQAAQPAPAASPAETPEGRKLSGTFEQNKGQLLFPVAGNYKIVRHFGRQKHPQLPNVVIDNSGIDIEAAKGAKARAVFPGTVSAIFRQSGYNNIVMIRHGNYLTIYANMVNIRVKKGDQVVQGQEIGSIYANPDDGGRSIMHFEIRKEKEKLNPMQWVK